MSTRELQRAAVLSRVEAKTLTLGQAATLLGVSYRQTKRLWRRFRVQGATGLQHQSVGRRSNRQVAAPTRTQAVALVREKYSGSATTRFGPTLAAEHLAAEDGVQVDHETLRRWMLDAGLWSRERQRSPYRQRRPRKAHFGELVQLDGSFHAWYEERGPTRCLITMVDDATSQMTGRFSAEESTWAAVAVLRGWIAQYGVPHALYTDWSAVYLRVATEAELIAGTEPLTQFGRMCAALGIRIIPAHSPQAKGRVERNHGTHQDRLVKKLRRLGVADDATANAYLATTYWAAHNARFAQPTAGVTDFHRAAPAGAALDRVFRLEETRVVGHDWVVRYHNRALQLERQSGQAPARGTVTVCESETGTIEIRYRDHPMRWTDITGRPAPPPRPPTTRTVPRKSAVPRADHPWRREGGAMPPAAPLWQASKR